jgi:hypothetical protein
LEILEATDSTLTLGPRRNWLRSIFDYKVIIDRETSAIILFDKAFGLVSRRQIPISNVDSVKMSVRSGHGFMLIPMYRIVRVHKDTQIDLWIEVRDMGKIELETITGLSHDATSVAVLGRRVAEYMQKPFIDTSRW